MVLLINSASKVLDITRPYLFI